jgi:molybdopterin-guanine dinucleotide biosynthesis protein A
MSSSNQLSVVIQAGGESRRMGQDKGLAPFLGKPLIERVVQRLSPIAAELLITTNRLPEYAFLGLPLFADPIPGRGALGGLFGALSAARQPFVGVVACDMPFANPRLLAAQRDLLVETGADIALPRNLDGLEPFHAVYRRETCLPPIQAALQADQWRVDAWFSQVKLRILEPKELRSYDPELLCFWNVNTPGELETAARLALKIAPQEGM